MCAVRVTMAGILAVVGDKEGDRTARGAIVLAALALLAFSAGRVGVSMLALLIAVVVAGEQFRIARAGGIRPVAAIGLATIVVLHLVAFTQGERAPRWLPPIAAGGLALAYVAMLRRHVRTNVTRALIATALPILIAGVLGAFIPAIRGLGGSKGAWGFLLLVIGATAGTAVAQRAKASRVAMVGGAALGALLVAGGLAIAWSKEYEAGRAIVVAITVALCVPLGSVLAARVEADLGGGTAGRRALALHRVGGALLAAPAFFFVFRALTT